MIEQYLKVPEAAKAIRLSPFRVRVLLREQKLDGVRPLGRGAWLVPVSAIQHYLGAKDGN